MGPRWLELDKIGTCHGNGVSDPVGLSQGMCMWVGKGAYTQVCACAVMYEDTNLPIEPQGHGFAAINKQPWLSVRR